MNLITEIGATVVTAFISQKTLNMPFNKKQIKFYYVEHFVEKFAQLMDV